MFGWDVDLMDGPFCGKKKMRVCEKREKCIP